MAPEFPEARADRFATRILHDEEGARVVAFHLAPGQQVPPHRSTSSVIVQVVEGTGRFRGSDGEALLGPGETAVFAPGEEHSIDAGPSSLRFVAVIAPRPR